MTNDRPDRVPEALGDLISTAETFRVNCCTARATRFSPYEGCWSPLEYSLQQELWRQQLLGSMGQVGSAGDNAAMESFFALLQKNVLNRKRWTTREELRIAIVTWIERTYHRRRRQERLGRLTPIEFELIMSKAADQAA